MAMPFDVTHSSAHTAVVTLSTREAVSRQSLSRRLCGGESAADVLAPLPTSTSAEPIALLKQSHCRRPAQLVSELPRSKAVMHTRATLLLDSPGVCRVCFPVPYRLDTARWRLTVGQRGAEWYTQQKCFWVPVLALKTGTMIQHSRL